MKRLKKKKKASNARSNEGQGPFFPSVQTKLAIGKADDGYEKEADSVADKVVNATSEGTSIQKKAGEEEQLQEKPISQSISTLQKKEMPTEEEPVQKAPKEEEETVQQKGEEEEETLQQKGEEEEAQTKPEEEEQAVQKEEEEEMAQPKAKEEEEPVQKKGNGKRATPKAESIIKNTKGQGMKMDKTTRHEMEKGFGADFSNVTIHTDSKAQETAKELGAQAFTTGNDIYFNEGKYDPSSPHGKHLLAHELTHTIQQSGNLVKKVQKTPNTNNTTPETCEGKEDISVIIRQLKSKAIEIIDNSSLSNDDKAAKKQTVEVVFTNEGVFSINKTKFVACDKINIPQLSGAGGNGFSGYSSKDDNEIGGLKSFKEDANKVLNNKDLDALLRVITLLSHEKRHLTISGMPTVDKSDVQQGSTETNPIELSTYLVEEILVNAEEIAINHRFSNGEYSVPIPISSEIHRYWKRILSILTPQKAEEMKQYIIKELETRYSSKDASNAISIGILNAMERGNWNFNKRN
ncbi:MAG: DUF4157 domain-containing protein [Flavobacteriaceae bacterium]